ncbi:MAG: pyruvate formate lyase-activating protein [Cellulomonadaceae bacterium]|jgi:pyruvate formate lyase activating enzyme|nr:pyruvate formate lyase-activating protein [Cellulomonadaceae bacterium]
MTVTSDADGTHEAPAAQPHKPVAIIFGDGHGGAPIELEVPTSPRRRTGAGLSGVQLTDMLDRKQKLAMMRSGDLGSVHSWELVTSVDGPGTRMTVFLNGCPLRCLYCHNPDTFKMGDGEPVTAEELLKKISRYRAIFRTSGGGITLSGGEVLQQPAFAAKIIRGAKQMGIHVTLDTSGYLGRALTDDMLRDVDLFLLDVKSGIPELYKKMTGVELQPTLDFGRRIAREGLPGGEDEANPSKVWLRFVCVPGYTDAVENVEIIAEYAAELQAIRPGVIDRVEILPFHQLGTDKWHELGLDYALEGVRSPDKETLERVREQFRSRGLTTF